MKEKGGSGKKKIVQILRCQREKVAPGPFMTISAPILTIDRQLIKVDTVGFTRTIIHGVEVSFP